MARVRFEMLSIASLGNGVHRLPINCWRLTVFLNPAQPGGVLCDGIDFAPDAEFDGALRQTIPFRFVAGGVLADGKPVNLDQVLTITANVNRGRGVIIMEYLEP